jgi:hypothetical protein
MNSTFIYNDGGRKESGFSGKARDCVCRSISIATNRPYSEIYDLINSFSKNERIGNRKNGKSSAGNGVYKYTQQKVMEKLGGRWTPLMTIGSGCRVHLTPSELPSSGRYVLVVSKHLCAWIDGNLHDTYDCSRNGTRCVYGYYKF